MPATNSELLASFLFDRDQSCPQCGYNLRSLEGTRCPECGEDLVLQVNVAEPRQKLVIAGLIGLSCGAGLNGLLLIYAMILVLRERNYTPDRFWIICGAGFLVELFVMLCWLRCWRHIRRLSTASRVLLVAICWMLTLVDVVIFSFTIK